MKSKSRMLFKKFSLFAVLFFALAIFLSIPGPAGATVQNYLQIESDLSAKAVEPQKPVQIHILIEIKAPEIVITNERPPVAVALVIDRSGSMGEAKKLDYAVKAGETLVKSLTPKDKLALIVYDDTVNVLSPLIPVENKDIFLKLLAGLTPGNTTFLSGGLEEGIKQLKVKELKGPARVLLLSDGLANEGITDMEGVSKIGGKAREQGISVSSIGLGLDYDENLMQLLAKRGGGQYYYVKDSEFLPRVFQEELNLVAASVTHSTSSRFLAAPGVKNVTVYGYSAKTDKNQTDIALSDFYSGESRQIMLTLDVDPGTAATQNLGTVEVTFSKKEGETPETIQIPLSVAVEKDSTKRADINAQAAESIKKVSDEALLMQAEQAQVKAMEELEKGNKDAARKILRENHDALAAAAPESPAIANKQAALAEADNMLDQAEQDATMRKQMVKKSKDSAWKSAQGIKSGYMLQLGDTGLEVTKLQELLKLKGFYKGDINATFDAATKDALIEFQKNQNLDQDGIAGPATQNALGM